jgi:hypothetical protein
MVVYGGRMMPGQMPDFGTETWEWDGASWSVVSVPPTHPGPRRHAAMTFGLDNKILMTGGAQDPTFAGELWGWNGTTWNRYGMLDPVLGFRHSHGMVWDQNRNKLVVAGGQPSDYVSPLVETCEWNGTGWTANAGATQVGFRHNLAVAYDPVRKVSLLSGGYYATTYNPFEYDGTSWKPVPGPGVYAKGTSMVFDARRGAIEWLVDPEGSGIEIWEWNGTVWGQRLPQPSLPALYKPAVVYDTVRGEIVMFGGRDLSFNASNATIAIGYEPNAATEACTSQLIDYDRDMLAGCADPDCAPRCAPLGVPTCPNNTCDPLEDCLLCPTDCGMCANNDCGDLRCSGSEDATSCPGDCP